MTIVERQLAAPFLHGVDPGLCLVLVSKPVTLQNVVPLLESVDVVDHSDVPALLQASTVG